MCHDLPPLHLWRRLLLRLLPGHSDLRLARGRAGHPADRPDPGPGSLRGARQSSARASLGVARPPGGSVPARLRLPAGTAARPAAAGARGLHPAAGHRAAARRRTGIRTTASSTADTEPRPREPSPAVRQDGSMGNARLHSIHIHPVKAFRSVPLTEVVVEPWGPAGDRRWMLIDDGGRV